MIEELMRYLEATGADQITFRKVGKGEDAHLNIELMDYSHFGNKGNITITQRLIKAIPNKRSIIEYQWFHTLKRIYTGAKAYNGEKLR